MQQPYYQPPFRANIPSIRPTQEQRDKQARDLYRFFVDQEEKIATFTYHDIRRIYPRSVYWYARYRWSWFIKIVSKERHHTFRCQGLKKYPEEYFVQAHRPRQALFFTHFAEAMRIAKARDLGQNPVSTITEPEPLEIADIRKDEEHYEDGDDEVPEEEYGESEVSTGTEVYGEQRSSEEEQYLQTQQSSEDGILVRVDPRESSKENQEIIDDPQRMECKVRTRRIVLLLVAVIIGWILWRNRFAS